MNRVHYRRVDELSCIIYGCERVFGGHGRRCKKVVHNSSGTVTWSCHSPAKRARVMIGPTKTGKKQEDEKTTQDS